MKALIGVDIGTGGTKAALFDEAGTCLAQAFRPSKLHRPAPGVVEEDPERQLDSVCRTIRSCVSESRVGSADVVAIGIDGQMAGVIGLGADGRHVTPYDSWLDTRCAAQIKLMDERCGEEVVRKTGCAPGFNHGPKKLWWMQARPKVYAKIKAFVQPGAYAAMRLCDLGVEQAFIDQTYLHFSGFADNVNSRWDPALCDAVNLDAAKLPRIVKSHAVVGGLSGAAARRCGLRADVPLVAGCGDTAASFLACGATRAGVCVDVAGTASVFSATTDAFRPDVRHRMIACARSATPGLWHPYAYINGGGMNLEWFRSHFAGSGLNGRVRRLSISDFDQLNRAAAKVDGSKMTLPMFVPHMGGRACPSQPELRGAWTGLSWDHSSAHLYHAILESVALEYGCFVDVLRELLPRVPLTELRVTGGGEKSELWNRIKSDVLQMPVTRIVRSEGAPRGVAMLAGFGVGLWRDLESVAREWIKTTKRVRPTRAAAARYRARLRTYREHLRWLGAITDNAKGS